MQYEVRALTPEANVARLSVDALDEADARRQVEARGLFVSAVKRRGGARGGGGISLVLFSQELLALLAAGLGVVEALEALLEKEANPALANVLGRLLAGLRDGKRFSSVLAEQSDRFPPLYIGIVKAAEGTSDLPRSLARYIDYQQRIDAVRSKVVSAAIYPAILLMVGGGVSVFLITYVVPRFAEVYQGAGRNLPFMSRLLLSWGQFAANHTALLLAGLGALAAVLVLGMLTEGGIPIVQAIDTVQGMVSPAVRGGLRQARLAVESGLPLSSAFAANGLTTPISLRMLRVGERTGDMGPMLTQSAAFYDGEISRWIDRFTRIFEPLLMAAIGLVVGAIVVLLYMPIFDLAGDMS
jgi:general secretion pathway protein F